MKRKLSDNTAQRVKHDGRSTCILWDSELRGFGLRLYPSGRKCWVYRTRGTHHKTIQLGDYPEVKSDDARARVVEIVRRAVDGDTVRRDLTVRELVKRFRDGHVSRRKGRRVTEDRDAVSQCRRIVEAWTSRKAISIGSDDVEDLLKPLRSKPFAHNRLRARVRQIWRYGMRKGWIPMRPNPTETVPELPERPRTRVLTADEREALLLALRARGALAIEIVWATARRPSEILNLKWSDIDLRRGAALLRDTKDGKDHWIPLPSSVVERLRKRPRFCDWVFPNRSGDGPATIPKRLWARIQADTGLVDVQLRDLRRDGATYLAADGTPTEVLRAVLGHGSSRTTERYVGELPEQRAAALARRYGQFR